MIPPPAGATGQPSVGSSNRLGRLLALMERDPGNVVLRRDAIREAIDAGDWAVADGLLDVGLVQHPDDGELLALRGLAHLQAQRYGDAETALASALAHGLRAPELHYSLAMAQFRQGRHAQALERLGAASVIEAVPVALVLRARCLHHLRRAELAIADCRAFLAIVPDDALAHGLLALLLQEEHRDDEARVHVEAALRQDPTQLEASLAMASMQAEGQDDVEAQATHEALLRTHPQCGRAWLGLGLLRLKQLHFEAAKLDLERAAELMPGHVGTWHVLGWIAIMTGNVAGALAAFEQALSLEPSFGETHGGLAVVAVMQGREEDARRSLQRALRLDGKSAAAQYAQALLLQRQGRHEDAQALLEAFLSLPVERSDMDYRELVGLQLRRFGAAALPRAGDVTLH